jgi:WD40 repeat protein
MSERDRSVLVEWQQFWRGGAHVFQKRPHLAAQEAADGPADSPVAAAARAFLAARRRPWIDWINRPRRASPCLAVLGEHGKEVYDADASPDGTMIATACRDGTVRLWDRTSGALQNQAAVKHGAATQCRFVDRETLIVRDAQALEAWTVKTLTTVRAFELPARAGCAALSADRRRLAAGSATTVAVWDLATGDRIAAFDEPECGTSWTSPRIKALAFSPDGSELLVLVWAAGGGSAHIRRTADGRERLAVQHAGLQACDWSPDGATLALAQGDTIRLLNPADGSTGRVLEGHRAEVTSCAFSPDGRWLVSGAADEQIRIWRMRTGDAHVILRGHVHRIASCRFLPGGEVLSASADATARLWRVREDDAAPEVDPVAGRVHACAWLPGGRLVFGGDDRALRLWSEDEGERVEMTLDPERMITACAAAPDGRRVAAAIGASDWRVADTAALRVWNLGEPGVEHDIDVTPPYRPTAAHFAPGGRWLIAAAEGWPLLHIVDTWSGRVVLQIVRPHGETVLACPPSPDGRLVATSGADGTVALWEAGTWRERWRIELDHPESRYRAVSACAFSPDGQLLATGTHGGDVALWRVSDGGQQRKLAKFADAVPACDFTAGGGHLIVLAGDSLVWLDVATGAVTVDARIADAAELRADGAAPLVAVPVMGGVRISRCRGLELPPPIVTPAIRFDDRRGRWNQEPTIVCPACTRESRGGAHRSLTCGGCGIEMRVNPFVADTRGWVSAS